MVTALWMAGSLETMRGAENPAPTNIAYLTPATGPIIYDNTREWSLELTHYYFPTNQLGQEATNEFGDEIIFTPTGKNGERTLGTIKFEYYLTRFLSGNETLRFRL